MANILSISGTHVKHVLKKNGNTIREIGRTGFSAFGAEGLAVFSRMNDGDDVLVGHSFPLKGNFTESEALVICHEI